MQTTPPFSGTAVARSERGGVSTSSFDPWFAVIALAGLLVTVGSFLPWLTVSGPLGMSLSRSGMEGLDGLVTVLLGIGILVGGLAGLADGRFEKAALVAAVLAVATIVMGVLSYVGISNGARELSEGQTLLMAGPGVGLHTALIGGALAAITAGIKSIRVAKR